MQQLLTEPAFDECSVTLVVLDLHCATMYILSCAHSDFCSLPVCLWKVGVLHDSFCLWFRGPDRACGTRCFAFAKSKSVIASVAERHDLTLMQPLHSGSAFTLSSATLAVLDLSTRVCYFSFVVFPATLCFILAFAER